MRSRAVALIAWLAVMLSVAGATSLNAGQPEQEAPVEVAWRSQVDRVGVASAGTDAREAQRLLQPGSQASAVTMAPDSLQQELATRTLPGSLDADPVIQAMIDQVSATLVYSYTGNLSGEWPAIIGGEPYTITTRHTGSGEPIDKATQLAYEHLEELGLDAEYHPWSYHGYTGRNVIGELPGVTEPEDVFIVSAHIDSTAAKDVGYHYATDPAPGADDNASGSAAILAAADILSQHRWDCTLRFALWTGEEQHLLGSKVYAQGAAGGGENILGVLNLDMIAYNSDAAPIVDLHAPSGDAGSIAMANLFHDVVYAYGLDLAPEVLIGNSLGNYSDNRSFWEQGYAAILAIEDFDDFTPYYHTHRDTLSTLNLPYHTEFVKAAVGTFAHLSDCLLTGVEGYVTEAGSGVPAVGVVVTMQDPAGQSSSTTTDDSGYYIHSLSPGVYTATVSAEGYLPATVANVLAVTHTVSFQAFALQPVPVIHVAPASLAAELRPGQAITHTLWLSNAGRADLSFLVHEASPTRTAAALPWLSVTPSQGTVSPGGLMPLVLTFDAGGLAPGVLLGLLQVESDDPITPYVDVPVALTVTHVRYLPLVHSGGE